MKKEEIGRINGVVHYRFGEYELLTGDSDDNITPVQGGNIMDIFQCLSDNFNQLKGKLYNLIESSIPDNKQQNAVKGLVKDFCNDVYYDTSQGIDSHLRHMGFHEPGEGRVNGSISRVVGIKEEE